jgi:phage gp29-like protein
MSAATTPEAKAVIDYRVRELLDDPRCEYDTEESYELAEYQHEIDKLDAITAQIAQNEQQAVMQPLEDAPIVTEQHPTTTPANRTEHIQEMIMDGYTDEEILAIHSEISQADITAAKEALLDLG